MEKGERERWEGGCDKMKGKEEEKRRKEGRRGGEVRGFQESVLVQKQLHLPTRLPVCPFC